METNTIGYVSKNSIADKYGILKGDRIISINGNQVQYWDEVRTDILIENMGENLDIKVLSDKGLRDVYISKNELKDISEKLMGIYPNLSPEILQILPGKPADQSGLKVGDKITKFNGIPITHSQEFVDLIKSNGSKDIYLSWLRAGNEMSATIHPESDSTIGIGVGKYLGTIKKIDYNVISAIPEGASDLYNYGVVLFLKSMWKIIKGDIAFSKAVGGPIKIAQYAGQSAEGGLLSFLGFMAMLSITLAIINILPFPALDGGHFTFLVYEGIFRKPVSHKVQIVVQNVGFIILMLFMAFVVYNDIIHI
jgi:regulator of sigma E protease